MAVLIRAITCKVTTNLNAESSACKGLRGKLAQAFLLNSVYMFGLGHFHLQSIARIGKPFLKTPDSAYYIVENNRAAFPNIIIT